jgi:hypothetical protein
VFLTTPTATFGSTRALEQSDGTDTSMFREFPKRRNDDNHQLEVPNWHLKPDLDL